MSAQANKALTLSIIIPAYNEENHIRACLDAIAKQSVMPDEVIVVDNNSTDRTTSLAKTYPFVTVINEKTQGIVYARNAGFDASKSDIIARIDADTIVPAGWVKRIKHYYSNDGHIDAALTGGGTAYNIRLQKLSGWLLNQIAYRFNKVLLGHYILWGSNMAFTRTQWQAVRNEVCLRDDIHEDIDLSIHLHQHGYHIDYKPSLKVRVALKRIEQDTSALKQHMRRWPQTMRVHHYKLWWAGVVGNVLTWLFLVPLAYLSRLRQ